MTVEIALLLALLGGTFVLFILEVLPIEVPALALLAALLLLGLVDVEEALSGLSNPAVVAIGALFVLSYALTKTGLLEVGVEFLERRVGHRKRLAVGLLLATVGVLSGFLNNTAIVAIFVPVAASLCSRLELSPSRVLLPLSYAAIFGGTLTLIGTSTNLLVSSVAADAGLEPFGMFEFTPFGAILLLVGLTYVLVFAPRLLPERVAPGDPTGRYELDGYLTEVRVEAGSALIGRTCEELGVGRTYDVNLLAVLRDAQRYSESVGRVPLEPGDVLLVQGRLEEMVRLRKELGVALLPDAKPTGEELAIGDLLTVEVLVGRGSPLVGHTLQELDFRRSFGAFVMAIRRHGATLRDKVALTRLHAWDALLMLVPRERLEQLRRSQDVVVLREHQLKLTRERGWWLVLLVLPAAVVAAALGLLEIAAAALLGVVALLVSRVLAPREVYDSIDWGVILLIAALVPVGHAMTRTGAAALLAKGVIAGAEYLPLDTPYAVLALLYLCTSLLTQMISNAAAALVVAPIAISLAAGLGVEPRPFLVAVAFAASAEFMTPMGYQTNLMVYAPGGYRFLDYTRFGAPLNLLFWLLATLLIPRFWAF